MSLRMQSSSCKFQTTLEQIVSTLKKNSGHNFQNTAEILELLLLFNEIVKTLQLFIEQSSSLFSRGSQQG